MKPTKEEQPKKISAEDEQAMIDEFNMHTVSLMEDFLEIQKNDPDTPADIKKEIVKFQKNRKKDV